MPNSIRLDQLRALLAPEAITNLTITEVMGDIQRLRFDLGPSQSVEVAGEDRDGNLIVTLLKRVTELAWSDADDPTTQMTETFKNLTVDYIRVDPEGGKLVIIFKGENAPGLALLYTGGVNKIVTERQDL